MNEDLIFALIVSLIASPLLAVLAVEMARHKGPQAIRSASKMAMAGGFIVGAFMFVSELGPPLVALAGAVLTAIAVNYYWKYMVRKVYEQLELASYVVSYGLDQFDSLLVGERQTISQSGLYTILSMNPALTKTDRHMIKHIARHASEIGHLVDVVSTPTAHGGASVAIYGISRDDLRTYEQRLRAKYSTWLD